MSILLIACLATAAAVVFTACIYSNNPEALRLAANSVFTSGQATFMTGDPYCVA